MEIKDVEALAELARLDLSEDEKKSLLADMGDILEYVNTIQKVEVGDVKSEYNITNVWREDKTEAREFSRKLIIDQFPEAQDGFLKVKKIL